MLIKIDFVPLEMLKLLGQPDQGMGHEDGGRGPLEEVALVRLGKFRGELEGRLEVADPAGHWVDLWGLGGFAGRGKYSIKM